SLCGHVNTAENANFFKNATGFVTSLDNPSTRALRNIQHDDAPLNRVAKFVDKPVQRRRISRTISFKYYSFKPFRMQDSLDGLACDTRKEFQNRNVVIQFRSER